MGMLQLFHFFGQTAIVKCLQIHITGILVRVSQTFAGLRFLKTVLTLNLTFCFWFFQWGTIISRVFF